MSSTIEVQEQTANRKAITMYAVLITDANLSGTITKTFHTEDEALDFENQVLESAGTWFEITDNQVVLLDDPATTLMTEDEAVAYGFI